MILPIYSLTPFTLLDFPERTACIIWFAGCNMRCAYCHNPEIVRGKAGVQSADDVLSFLTRRQGLLDGVVLSGGEATAYTGLLEFVAAIKRLGFAIKLDTNGLRPEIVRDFLDDGLLDYVALDYKAPPEKFKKITGTEKFTAFSETLSLLCDQGGVPFEVRTTVHTGLLNEDDIDLIIADLEGRNYRGPYYVQNFRADNDRPTLGRLPPQSRILDTTRLRRPAGFRLEFRNFDDFSPVRAA